RHTHSPGTLAMARRSVRSERVPATRHRSDPGRTSSSRSAVTWSPTPISLHAWIRRVVSQAGLVCGGADVLSRTMGRNGSHHHGVFDMMLASNRCTATWLQYLTPSQSAAIDSAGIFAVV